MRFIVICLGIAGVLVAQTRRQGDWVVRTAETVDNASIVLAGNLIVEGPASLTLNNVTLAIEDRAQKPFGIEVRPGASLTVTGSTIRPDSSGGRFVFRVDGARFAMRNSTLWAMAAIEPWNGVSGLTLTGVTGAVFEDNVLQVDAVPAVRLVGSRNALFLRNRFVFPERPTTGTAIELTESHWNTVERNVFLRTGAIANASHGNDFIDNEVWLAGEFPGFVFWDGSAHNYIARNRFRLDPLSDPSCFAVRIYGAPFPNYILDNTVDGPRYAFLVSYSAGTVVAGNRLTHLTDFNVFGIDVYRSRNTQVLNNEIADSKGGISIIGGENNQMRGNRIANSSIGVMLFQTANNAIAGNVFEKNANNLDVVGSSDNLIEANSFLKFSRQAWDPVGNLWRGNYFDDAAQPGAPYLVAPAALDAAPAPAPLEPATASLPDVVKAEPRWPRAVGTEIRKDTVWQDCRRELDGWVGVNGAKLTIRNCTLTTGPALRAPGVNLAVGAGGTLEILNSALEGDGVNAVIGIMLEPGGTLILRNSTIRNSSAWDAGIMLRGDGAIIENNQITGAPTGIKIESSSGHRITGNVFSGHAEGVMVTASRTVPSGLVFEGNVFLNNLNTGLTVDQMTQSRVSGNRFEGSRYGAGINGSGNIVYDNLFVANGQGLTAQGENTLVYGNSFIDNGSRWFPTAGPGQAASRGGGVQWSYEGRGNYWSDYAGTDSNGDGAGDTPYDLWEGVVDSFPLMRPPASAGCNLAVSPSDLWFPAEGGSQTLAILGNPSCACQAASGSEWVQASADLTSARATVAVSSNPVASHRSGTAVIAGQTVRIHQAPAGCAYSIAGNTQVSQPIAGGGRVALTAPAGCAWTALANSDWLHMMVETGSGSGEVSFWFPENKSGRRTGTLTIAGQTYTVTQNGPSQ